MIKLKRIGVIYVLDDIDAIFKTVIFDVKPEERTKLLKQYKRYKFIKSYDNYK